MPARTNIPGLALLALTVAGPDLAAAELVALWGAAEVSGYSEAADWDTSDGFATTATVIGGGGWDQDNTCGVGACLDVASGVMTPGGSPNTRATVTALPDGASDYRFSSLAGEVTVATEADVGAQGIISDARGAARALLLVTVTETTDVAMSGGCTTRASGPIATATCVAAVLGLDGRLPWLTFAACGDGGGTCDRQADRTFEMRAGTLYLVALFTLAETSTEASASAFAGVGFTLRALPAR